MPDLPRHPEIDGRSGPGGQDRPPAGRPWAAYAVGIVAAAVLAMMIVLHLTGAVGPGAH